MRSFWRAPVLLGAITFVNACSASEAVQIIVDPVNEIAFSSARDGNYEIYTITPGGGSAVNITHNGALDYMPSWSPDGTKIVFSSDRSGIKQIWVMGADGSNPTRLTNGTMEDYSPAWSYDGAKIAFTRDVTPTHQQIFVMNANGTGQVNISNTAHNDIQPAWNPDGTTIAFASDRHAAPAPANSFYQIYTMTATGGSVTRLTINNNGIDYSPAWSPDGTRLAFARDGGGDATCHLNSTFDILVLDLVSDTQNRLTGPDCFQQGEPTWSPDGLLIAFISDEGSAPLAFNIWLKVIEGSSGGGITSTQADLLPAWSKN